MSEPHQAPTQVLSHLVSHPRLGRTRIGLGPLLVRQCLGVDEVVRPSHPCTPIREPTPHPPPTPWELMELAPRTLRHVSMPHAEPRMLMLSAAPVPPHLGTDATLSSRPSLEAFARTTPLAPLSQAYARCPRTSRTPKPPVYPACTAYVPQVPVHVRTSSPSAPVGNHHTPLIPWLLGIEPSIATTEVHAAKEM